MAEVFNLRHESGDWSEYNDTTGASPGFEIAASAALGTGSFGIVIDFDQSPPAASKPKYVSGSDFDTTSSDARFGFRYDLNNVAMNNNGDSITLLNLNDDLGFDFLQVEIHRTAACVFRMDCLSEEDGATTACISASAIPRGADTTVELAWARPTGSAASDGTFQLYVNETLEDEQTDLDNYDNWLKLDDSSFNLFIDHNETNGTGTVSGQFHIDEITFRDDSTEIFGATIAFRLLGLAADSGRIYATGLEDTTTLFLYDYLLSDLSEGASPSSFGAATNAGIDAASYGIFPVPRPGYDGYLYLRGRDGSDVKAQKFDYDSAATGWTDIGAGSSTWDASKMSVGLHPSIFDPDDLMAAFTDNEVYRSRDEGTSWTSQGSTTGSLLTSTRHPIDDNKLLVGGCQPGTLDYSHNYGKTFSAIDIDGVSASRDHRVLASGDDGYVTQSSSAFVDNSTINLGDAVVLGENEGWVRFAAVGISPSSVIDSAYIQFEASNTRSGSVIFAVFGEDADDPTAASDLADFNGRTRTSASVSWSPSDPWTAGCTYTTPDISTVVQEIVDRSGWATNNAMQFFIEYSSGCVGTTRQAESFDTDSANAPLLHIESTGSGGVINHIEVSL